MKLILILLLLTSCSQKPTFEMGDCVVSHGYIGGYYKIIGMTDKSYIGRAYGKYVRSKAAHPVVFSKTANLGYINCFEGPFMDVYMKHLKELKSTIDKEKKDKLNRKKSKVEELNTSNFHYDPCRDRYIIRPDYCPRR